jgi:serine/threonine protein kinase
LLGEDEGPKPIGPRGIRLFQSSEILSFISTLAPIVPWYWEDSNQVAISAGVCRPLPLQSGETRMSMTDTMGTKRSEPLPNKGTAPSVDFELNVPSRYQILSEIGQGGMGIVYKARDTDMVEIVALKVLKPEIAADEAMRETLRKEVVLARKVTHRNVCRIHEFHRSDVSACVSMEFIEGESLLSKLRRAGPFSPSESIAIARQICAGLREAHAQGIVHRDLKPANIMLGASGCVKIMDFGIARLSQDTAQLTRTFVGTPNYMSPEQVELKPTGPRSDIYSLGLVLYEMATSVTAFQGDSPILVALDQLRRTPIRPRQIVPTIPASLEQVILKCLQKKPSQRYGSVDELDAALHAAMQPHDPALVELRQKISSAVSQSVKAARAARMSVSFKVRQIQLPKLRRVLRAGWQQRSWLTHCDELFSPSRIRLAQVSAVLGIAFLGTAIAFGLATAKSGHHPLPTPTAAIGSARPSLLAAVPRATATPIIHISESADPDTGVLSGEADLSGATGISTDDSDLSESMKSTPGSDPSSSSTLRHSVSARTVFKKRAKVPIQPSVALPIPTGETQQVLLTLDAVKPGDSDSSNAAKKTATSSASETNTSPVNPTVSKQEQLPFATTYLEVGSFKDAEWADSAVDRLSHLGFKAVSVHKGHLWTQSYHVEVGPFTTVQDLEKAERDLTAQGLKPHAVR